MLVIGRHFRFRQIKPDRPVLFSELNCQGQDDITESDDGNDGVFRAFIRLVLLGRSWLTKGATPSCSRAGSENSRGAAQSVGK